MRNSCIWAILLLCLSGGLDAQWTGVYREWDEKVLENANTAARTEYLSEDEKKVILILNLVRADGPLFADTFFKDYLALKKKKTNRYIRSLYRDLKDVKGLPMLQPEKDLYDIAKEHATRSGMKGYEGHKGFKGRYNPVMKKYMEVGENIYYGEYTPDEIVLQLLIDEGIQDLGHRNNILNPRFNSIGVCIKPHKTYFYNCVMSFGMLPRSYKDFIR
jgi:hypothetical protein